MNGIEQSVLQGAQWHRTLYPFDHVAATVEDGRLVLELSGTRYVVEAKNPERYVEKIEHMRANAASQKSKAPKPVSGTGVICAVCHRPQANATCKQCGEPVCPSHSHYIAGATYCMRCKILCPKCKSENIMAQKRGFRFGSAAGKWLIGGVFGLAHEAMVAGDMERVCLACGHKWRLAPPR